MLGLLIVAFALQIRLQPYASPLVGRCKLTLVECELKEPIFSDSN